MEFTAAVARLRKEHPTFRRSRFFDGRPVRRGQGEPLPDIAWLTSDGVEMQPEDWDEQLTLTVGVFLNGQGIRERDVRGQNVTDVHFLVYFNAHGEDLEFTLPSEEYSPAWEIVVDTGGEGADLIARPAGAKQTVLARSLVVLRAYQQPEAAPDHSVAASLAVLSGSHAPSPLDPGPGVTP
ncbi:MAG: glgX [Cryobacterium sp.]|nr:glgX [Cryobacterium sp.]